MAEKKKAAPRKRNAKPKPPAEEPQVTAQEQPEPLAGEPQLTRYVPADGTLLREDGNPIVYVMDKGQRRPFADLETFHARCGGGATITVLSHEKIDPITVGPEVTSASDL